MTVASRNRFEHALSISRKISCLSACWQILLVDFFARSTQEWNNGDKLSTTQSTDSSLFDSAEVNECATDIRIKNFREEWFTNDSYTLSIPNSALLHCFP
jgi:hypothetical protein